MVFDADQNSLANASQDDVDSLVRSGRLDIEASIVRSGAVTWAYYDRDDDGRMDVGFRTARNSPAVAEVLAVEGSAPVSDNDYIGTLAIRPHLVANHQAALLAMLDARLPRTWVAQSEESVGLPDPLHHHFMPQVREQDVDGWEHAIAIINSRGFTSILVDVDRDSFRGRNRSLLDNGIHRAVMEGHFKAELGYIATDAAAWAFYDTDHDGEWDVVLCQVDDHGEHRHNAFRRGAEGWAHDEALVGDKLIRPSLVRRSERRRFSRLSAELFTADVVE
jgi:hypothetical protein